MVGYICGHWSVSADSCCLTEHNHDVPLLAPTPACDKRHFAPSRYEIGEDFLAIVDTEQSKGSNETYEDDGDLFDLEENEDIDQAHGASQDHRADQDHAADHDQTALGLHSDVNQPPKEDQHKVQDGLTAPLMSREASRGISDIDNDEITYEDEDEEDNEATNHEGDTEGPGDSESDIDSVKYKTGTSGGPRESLKRLRPGEDGELAQVYDTQGTWSVD